MVLVSADKIAIVKNIDDMDDNSFELHINNRHADSLGGLGDVNFAHSGAYVVHCWRIFHKTLHRLRQRDINHEHAPYQGGQIEQSRQAQAG